MIKEEHSVITRKSIDAQTKYKLNKFSFNSFSQFLSETLIFLFLSIIQTTFV